MLNIEDTTNQERQKQTNNHTQQNNKLKWHMKIDPSFQISQYLKAGIFEGSFSDILILAQTEKTSTPMILSESP